MYPATVVTVRFVRMWDGFSPQQDEKLVPVVRQAVGAPIEFVRDQKAHVDIEVSSVYPSRMSTYKNFTRASWARLTTGHNSDPRSHFLNPPKSQTAKIGIWYTAENVRPPATGWDITLSFDPTGWTPTNIYLPYWQLITNLYGGKSEGFLGRTISIEELISPREGRAGDRHKFCCAFIRNPDPVRMRAIAALRQIGEVDVYGIAGAHSAEDKMSIAANYRFVLCFENDLYPGYVTEKVFDAWATGAVPLWWGIDFQRTLNSDALLNLNDFPTIKDFIDSISKLEECRDDISLMSSLPLVSANSHNFNSTIDDLGSLITQLINY
jgi:hypothetical protein